MNSEFMESVWWVFKELWDRELIYEGFKVSPYCPRCATPLSNFEMAQGYADKEDIAITVKFQLSAASSQLLGDRNLRTTNHESRTYLIAWTTTPWTLPGNLLLAVNEKVNYAVLSNGKENLILAKERLDFYKEELKGYKKIKELKGKEL